MKSIRPVAFLLALAACSNPVPPAGPAGASFGLSVDGVPANCAVASILETEAEAEVQISMDAGAELEVLLDGRAVTDAFDGAGTRRAQLAVSGTQTLRVTVTAGAEEVACEVGVSHRPAAAAAGESLDGASAAPVLVARSDETGAASHVSVDVPTTGATPRERADDFLARFGDLFGADPGTLRFVRERVSSDGWASVRYEQVLGEVRGFRAGVTVQLDDAGHVRSAHAHLFPDRAELPTHQLDVGGALALAPADMGTVRGATRVYYDVARTRAGWWIEGVGASVLVDDADARVVERVEGVLFDAPVALVRAIPEVWTSDMISTEGAFTGPTVLLTGPADGEPVAEMGQMPSAADEALWRQVASVASYAESALGAVSYGDYTHGTDVPGWTAREAGRTRVTAMESVYGNASYSPYWDTMFFGSDLRNLDVVCHEFGHALHFHESSFAEIPSTFFEALADGFMLGCEGSIDESRDRYSLDGDASIGFPVLRDISVPDNLLGDEIASYDTLLERGLRARDLDDQYVPTFLLTHALYLMNNRYRVAHRTIADMVHEAMAWQGYETYPDLRDRWISTAHSYARAGREGFTNELVCSMARAFRDTGLDGEYGVGATCSERAKGIDFVCTHRFCQLCDEVGDVPPESVCPPATLEAGQPTCQTAYGTATCVGSIAVSPDGCAEGSGRHCWCVADGEGARWDCTPDAACRDLPRLTQTYCPEDARPPEEVSAPAGCMTAAECPMGEDCVGGACM